MWYISMTSQDRNLTSETHGGDLVEGETILCVAIIYIIKVVLLTPMIPDNLGTKHTEQ